MLKKLVQTLILQFGILAESVIDSNNLRTLPVPKAKYGQSEVSEDKSSQRPVPELYLL